MSERADVSAGNGTDGGGADVGDGSAVMSDHSPASGPGVAGGSAAAGSTAGAGTAGSGPARGRRGLALAVGGCVLGAALTLVVAGATWVSGQVGAGAAAAPLHFSLSGGTLAPAATALGLVGLAGAVAVPAARRLGRLLAGLVVLAAGFGVVIVTARVGADPSGAARAASSVRELAAGGRADLSGLRAAAWPWVSFAGGLVLAVTGIAVVVYGRSWPALGGRYEAPAARPVNAWDALERGEDPT